MRVKREDIKWALDEGDDLIGDDDGVMLFGTRKEARRYRQIWAKFYRQHEMNLKAPHVVKVRVRVTVIKRDGKPQEASDDS